MIKAILEVHLEFDDSWIDSSDEDEVNWLKEEILSPPNTKAIIDGEIGVELPLVKTVLTKFEICK